jgi:hypothetical protein
MVVASLSLFVAMSGVGYAAATVGSAQIKSNAVLSRHIKNGQVKSADLRNNAVNGAKVSDGSLTGDDLADASVKGADLADGSVDTKALAPNAVNGSKVADNSLTGGDVADNGLTGGDIDESTLGQVPDAAKLGGKSASAFISSTIYKAESAVGPGTTLGDNTSVIAQACNPGDVLLSGGPANIAATSTLLESFPTPGSTNSWSARINKNGQTDNFSVVVLCAQR